jgi:catechol 2,3-dioxygenase-like lactoylglutathione lyase family enzyme
MTKLAHVCIETQDLDKTEVFYRGLGLRRQFDFKNKDGLLVGFYLAFENESFIEVILNRMPQSDGVIKHFAIETDDIDQARADAIDAGIDVGEKEFSGDRLWMFTCRDPNGIFIEVMQYTQDSMQRVGGVCEVDYMP